MSYLGIDFKFSAALRRDKDSAPTLDLAHELGTPSLRFKKIHSGEFVGSLSGAAATADAWTNPVTINLAGDASGTVNFDGSTSPKILSVTVINDSHTHDTRYFTESESDTRFVNVIGDTMTGSLTVDEGVANTQVIIQTGTIEIARATGAFIDLKDLTADDFDVRLGHTGQRFDVGATSGVLLNGILDMGTNKITNVVDPTTDQEAATKKYVDDTVTGAGAANKVDKGGDIMIGALVLSGAPTIDLHASTKKYVDDEVAGIVDSAPAALDTLNELAAALNDDPSFATTITGLIGAKVSKGGDSMSGVLAMGTNKITGLGAPSASTDAATRGFVEAHSLNTSNPHSVTAGQVGSPTNTAFTNHTTNTSNPHNVTASQVGALTPAGVQASSGQKWFQASVGSTSGTIPWSLDAQQTRVLTLNGASSTLSNPINPKAGGTYILIVKQDATGNRTLLFGSAYKFPGGTAPTLSTGASAVDVITFVSDGTNMYGVDQLDFS